MGTNKNFTHHTTAIPMYVYKLCTILTTSFTLLIPRSNYNVAILMCGNLKEGAFKNKSTISNLIVYHSSIIYYITNIYNTFQNIRFLTQQNTSKTFLQITATRCHGQSLVFHVTSSFSDAAETYRCSLNWTCKASLSGGILCPVRASRLPRCNWSKRVWRPTSCSCSRSMLHEHFHTPLQRSFCSALWGALRAEDATDGVSPNTILSKHSILSIQYPATRLIVSF